MKKNLLLIIAFILLVIPFVSSAFNGEVYDYQGNWLRQKINYSVFGARNITASDYICISGDCKSSWSTGIGVNSTQMENITLITIKESWLTTFFNSLTSAIYNLFSTNDTVLDNRIININSTIQSSNASWLYDSNCSGGNCAGIIYWANGSLFNETNRIDSLNLSLISVNDTLYFINSTLRGQIISVNNSVILINNTLDGKITSVNNSFILENTTLWNRINSVNSSSLSINTTANIQNLLNGTGIYSTFNQTYHDYVVANYTNNSNLLNGFNSSYFMPNNKSVSGDFNFNGGWLSGGLSIVGGNIFAQIGYFYNISALNVNTMNVNGSLYPAFNNMFDLGSSLLTWRDLWMFGSLRAGQGNFSGTVYINNGTDVQIFNETTRIDTLNSTITDNNASWLSTYNATYASWASNVTGNYLNLSGTNANQNLNIGIYNFTTTGHLSGQPITGAIGSGIIWANGTNTFAEVVVNCSGLYCSYGAFKVRLVNVSNIEKYCDIPAATRLLTNNQHSVLYVDNNCAVQETSIQTYIKTSLSPGGQADFANVVMANNNPYNTNGIGLENKRIIKIRKLLLRSSGQHLETVSGFDRQLNTFPSFNITTGEYVYLMDIVNTSLSDTNVNKIEAIYHTGASTWGETDFYGLNYTQCDTGTGNEVCTNTGKYRRIFVFMVGYTENGDVNQLHQLLPLQSTYYNTLADCMDTNTNPLTYTLPTFYQYSARMLYAYCSRPAPTALVWNTNWINLRGTVASTSTSGVDTSIFLTKDGMTPLTGNWQVGNYNITNISKAQGSIANFTFGRFGMINVSNDLWVNTINISSFFSLLSANDTSINNSALHVGESNRTKLDCSNITGATSNLCTLTAGTGVGWNRTIAGNLTLQYPNDNVGIGTDNPLRQLHINGTNDMLFLEASRAGGNTPYMRFYYNYSGANFNWNVGMEGTAGNFVIAPGAFASAPFVINRTNGNVGIGTTSPIRTLEVYSTGNNGNVIRGSSNSVWGASLELNSTGTGGKTWAITSTGSSDTAGIGNFQIVDRSAGTVHVVVQNTTGNVGIGTTSPGAKLNVYGSSPEIRIEQNPGEAGSGLLNITVAGGAGNTAAIRLRLGPYIYATSEDANKILFGADRVFANAKMVFDTSTGNVGIGTTSPNAQLQVHGATGVNISGTGDLTLGMEGGADEGAQINWNGVGTYLTWHQDIFDNYMRFWGDATADGITLVLNQSGQIGMRTNPTDSVLTIGKQTGKNELNVSGVLYVNSTSGNLQVQSDTMGISTRLITTGGYAGISLRNGSNTEQGFLYYFGDAFATASRQNGTELGTNHANPLKFLTSNTERMRIESGGNVGIGTASPTQPLEIKTGTNQIIQFMNNGASAVKIQGINDAKNANVPFQIVGSNVSLNAGATVGVYVNNNGNVGIGTVAPAQKLHINTSINDGLLVSNDTIKGIMFVSSLVTGSLAIGTTTNYPLIFGTNNVFPQMTLSTAGYLGIGTTSPYTKLQVNGLFSVSAGDVDAVNVDGLRSQTTGGSTYYDNHGVKTYFRVGTGAGENAAARTVMTFDNSNGNVGIGTTSPNAKLNIGPTSSSTNQIQINGTVSSANLHLGQFAEGSYIFNNYYYNAAHTTDNSSLNSTGFLLDTTGISFQHAPASATPTRVTDMFISSSGNVGIGTTTPSEKLQVNGNALLSSIGTSVEGTYIGYNSYDLKFVGNYWNNAVGPANEYGNITFKNTNSNTANPLYYFSFNAGSKSDILNIRDDGNVGIGTTAPDNTLHIEDAAAASRGITVQSAASYVGLQADSGGINPRLFWASADSSTLQIGNTDSNAGLGTFNAYISILTGGNVGIGTAAPTHKLNVLTNVDSDYIANFTNLHATGAGVIMTAGRSTEDIIALKNKSGSLKFSLRADGEAFCYGSDPCWNFGSSEDIKKDIIELNSSNNYSSSAIKDDSNILTEFRNTPVFSFKYKNDNASRTQIGLIAEYAPDAINGNNKSFLSAGSMANYLWVVTKAQDERITQLEKDKFNMNNTINDMKKALCEIKPELELCK